MINYNYLKLVWLYPHSYLRYRHIEKEAKEILERCGEIPAYVASFDVLTQLTGYKLTRGMLCAMYRPRLRTPEEVCQGAIFRSAAALNMDGILLTSDCSDPLYRRSLRVSMGTVFQIPWTYFDKQITWPMEGQAFLKEQGFQTVAMALRDDTVNIDDPGLHKEEKLAIVLGTEGEGLTSQTIASCDYTVKIPMSHGVDSLNVAAASAVAFWELGKI